MRYCRTKVPALSRRRQPPRRVPPRNVSRLFSAIRPLLPGEGIDSLRLRLRSSMPGGTGETRQSQRSCPILSASTAPARPAPERFTPRCCLSLVTAGEAATAPAARSRSLPGNGRQVTANTGSRPVPARLDTWTRAARLSTLRPLPPTPPFPHALSRSDQWPQYVGGRGLRSPLKRATVSPNPFTEERRF